MVDGYDKWPAVNGCQSLSLLRHDHNFVKSLLPSLDGKDEDTLVLTDYERLLELCGGCWLSLVGGCWLSLVGGCWLSLVGGCR